MRTLDLKGIKNVLISGAQYTIRSLKSGKIQSYKRHSLLLIGMPWWTVEQPYYALAYVGGIIKKAGWKCRIEDLNIKLYRQTEEDKKKWETATAWSNKKDVDALYDKYKNYIQDYLDHALQDNTFDIVAFTINPWTNPFVLKAAEYIKSLKPETPILFGGLDCFPAYTSLKAFENNPNVPDVICQGECEIALPQFLKEFETTKDYRTKVKGFAYRTRKEVVNNGEPELPILYDMDVIADYSQFDFKLYTGLGGFPSFLTRGCTNRCNFCSESPNFKKFRFRNPQIVIHEIREGIKYASQVNNFYHIMFTESIQNGNTKIFEKFVDLLLNLKKEHIIIWTSIMALRKDLTDTLIQKIYRAGCWRIFWGFESGSQHVIDLMKKNFKLEDAKRIIVTCHNLGMQNLLPLIIGFPGETTEDFLATLDFVFQYRIYGTFLDPDQLFAFPNSNLHSRYRDFGLANNHLTEWFTEDRKNNASTRLFRSFIARNILHNSRYWNLESIDHLDFNEYSLASEMAAISYGMARKLKNEKKAEMFLGGWAEERRVLIPIEDLNYWHPANIPMEVDLRNWFEKEKNGEGQRRNIISFIMELAFRHELTTITNGTDINSLTKISGSTRLGIDMINGIPVEGGRNNESPIVLRGDDLFLEGWAIDDVNNRLAGGVYVKIDDKVFPAKYGFRKQHVLDKLGELYTNSGFARRMFVSEIGKGKHYVSIITLTNDGSKYFLSERILDIEIE